MKSLYGDAAPTRVSPLLLTLGVSLAIAIAAAGCSGDDGRETESDPSATITPTSMGTLNTESGSESQTETGTLTEGTASASQTGSSSTAGPTTATDSDSDSDSDSATDSESNSDSDSDSSTTGPPDPVCGNGVVEGTEECDDGDDNDKNKCSNACTNVPCEEQESEMNGDVMSYIWIANSTQGTVSKVNTMTLVEEARYRVRPDSAGNPSRTSVGLSGDVVVANRSGGIVKIFTDPDDCQDTNGMPGIQTSTGPNDILPWGVEECIAWYQPFNYQTQRPVTWSAGTLNEETCQYEDPKVWTSGRNGNTADILLLDGDDGTVEAMAQTNSIGWAGLYGGSVDGDDNFWTVDHNWNGPSTLIRVDRETMEVTTWPVTGQVHYGLTVDSVGRAWLCGAGGVSRFDPMDETWQHLAPGGGSALGGCMTDGAGTLWHSPYPQASLIGVDTETLQVVQTIPIPAYVHGVSIDFEGNVWGVTFGGSQAFRVDPETNQVDIVNGLVGAYTYSDMTGFALATAGSIE